MKTVGHNIKHIYRLIAVMLVGLLLAACSTETGMIAEDIRPDYIATVALEPGLSKASLEARYGGKVLLYEADQGFALLGFDRSEAQLSTLTLESNQNTMASSVSAQGVRAWAGGGEPMWGGGVRAWAGGVRAWAGGVRAWAGGVRAWAGGEPMWAGGGEPMWGGGDPTGTPFENHDAWEQIGLYEAHLELAPKLGDGVVVAVIDTGLDLAHPVFADRLVPGWDFIDGDAVPQEEGAGGAYGHGTAVAGVILQVAPQAKIMPLRILDSDGFGDTDDFVLAMDYAIENGADIINFSGGSAEHAEAVELMLGKARDYSVAVITAAGNSGDEHVLFPANRSSSDSSFASTLVGVGSVNAEDIKSDFSTYGLNKVETVAPGEAIFTAYPDESVAYATGTSFSVPMVSGALALALAEPALSKEVENLPVHVVEDVMDDLYELEGNGAYSDQLGKGRLDIEKFLNKAF